MARYIFHVATGHHSIANLKEKVDELKFFEPDDKVLWLESIGYDKTTRLEYVPTEVSDLFLNNWGIDV